MIRDRFLTVFKLKVYQCLYTSLHHHQPPGDAEGLILDATREEPNGSLAALVREWKVAFIIVRFHSLLAEALFQISVTSEVNF